MENRCIDCIYCAPTPEIVLKELGYDYVYCCVVPIFLGDEFGKEEGMLQVDCSIIYMTENFAKKDIKCQSFKPYD